MAGVTLVPQADPGAVRGGEPDLQLLQLAVLQIEGDHESAVDTGLALGQGESEAGQAVPLIAHRILDLTTLADGPLPERFTDRQLQVKAGLALGGAGQGELELQRQGDCLATGQVARCF